MTRWFTFQGECHRVDDAADAIVKLADDQVRALSVCALVVTIPRTAVRGVMAAGGHACEACLRPADTDAAQLRMPATLVFDREGPCGHGLEALRAHHIEVPRLGEIRLTDARLMHVRDVAPAGRAKVLRQRAVSRVIEACMPRGPR